MPAEIWQMIAAMGIPSAVTGLCVWWLEHRIQRREKEHDRQEELRRKNAAADAEKKELDREQLELIIIQGNNAAIALAEATAKAVQRIPDAHCNGDMHAALDFAAEMKKRQKEFFQKKGIEHIFE